MKIRLYGNRKKPSDKSAKRGGRKVIIVAMALLALMAEDITRSPAVRTANGVVADGVYTVLVLGNSGGNSDTLMLCSRNTNENKLSVVSIPRDTLVNVSWSVKKANSLFAMGGINGAMEGVCNILGFEPNNYVVLDTEALVALVDTIGGGAGYFNGDIGRIATQQDFLKTVAAQCLQIGNVTKIKQFADIFIEYVDMDLTWGNLVWYGQQFLRLTDDDIAFYTLPGN